MDYGRMMTRYQIVYSSNPYPNSKQEILYNVWKSQLFADKMTEQFQKIVLPNIPLNTPHNLFGQFAQLAKYLGYQKKRTLGCPQSVVLLIPWPNFLVFSSVLFIYLSVHKDQMSNQELGIKGQLILKCLFGVFNFFPKTNKNKWT